VGRANIGTHCSPTPRLVRIGRVLALCAFTATVLSSCGAQFAYNRLDWIAHYYLANQVTLDDTQSRALRSDLDTFFAWHRHSELPRYAGFLDRVANDAARPIEVARFEAGRREVEGFMRDSVTHAAPDTARWLNGLRPEQIDELFASFAEKERKARDEHCDASLAERKEESAEKFIDNVEDWTGKLDRTQRRLIKTRLASFDDDVCQTITTRERSRREFRELIDRYRNRPEFAQRIAQFLAQPRGEAEDRDRLTKLLAEINHSLTPEQRARTIDRLRTQAKALRSLSAEPSV